MDPSAEDNAALFYASLNGYLEIVKLLKSHPRFREEDSDSDSSLSENESSLAESDD